MSRLPDAAVSDSSAPISSRAIHKFSLVSAQILFLVLCLSSTLPRYLAHQGVLVADDAYYYFVVAKHIVLQHSSSFDGFTLTNGYHPLWMVLLTLQYKVIGQSLLLTRALEIILCSVGLYCSLLLLRLPGTLSKLMFSIGFYVLVNRFSLNGMETASFVCFFCVFVYCATRDGRSAIYMGLLDGLSALLAIFARLDAAVFVLPFLLMSPQSKLRRAISFATVLSGSLFYVVFNRAYFGVSLPISGEVKSLGGLQVNYRFLHELINLRSPSSVVICVSIALSVGSLLIFRQQRDRSMRVLTIAYCIGLATYLIRLGFFSSWRVWPWYGYPMIIGYLICFPKLYVSIGDFFEKVLTRRTVQIMTVVTIMIPLCFGTVKILKGTFKDPYPYYKINALALSRVGPELAASRVAMGDRAGEFAYLYPGGVNQMEGLVNDREYLKVLQSRGNVKALLCSRDVKFVLSYEPELGTYSAHSIQTVRDELSQFPAPNLEVRREDEILKAGDLSVFRDADREQRNYLYIWKLSC